VTDPRAVRSDRELAEEHYLNCVFCQTRSDYEMSLLFMHASGLSRHLLVPLSEALATLCALGARQHISSATID